MVSTASAAGAARTVLYLHGFASGPDSFKGRAFDEHLGRRGMVVDRLDLRVPDRNGLRVSAMIELTRRAADAHSRVVVIGSSLGGLVAAHVAAHHAAVLGAVLMAPAFGFADRWASSFGPTGLDRWRRGVPLRVPDHAGGPPLAVDYGFYEDVAQVEAEWMPCTAAGLRRDIPLLVFHGRHDDTVDIEASRKFAAAHPRVELRELDDGHPLIDSLPVLLAEATTFVEALFRGEVP